MQEDEGTISFHGVALLNFAPLLYPGGNVETYLLFSDQNSENELIDVAKLANAEVGIYVWKTDMEGSV